MSMSIAMTKSMRECGLNEYWLQEQICSHPEILVPILDANVLEVVAREKKQSSGGRLDILLRDPDNERFYELEVMLGDTNESHIIRTIEYWDIEKKRWPKKQHIAVLVAERINSRFYNVVNLLSLAVPIIGIQANIISVEGKDALHFVKIIDSYEEPEIELEESKEKTKPEYWKSTYPEQYEATTIVQKIVSDKSLNPKLTYHPTYVAFGVNGKHRMWLSIRKNGRIAFEVQIPEINHSAVEEILNNAKIDFKKSDSQFKWSSTLADIKANEKIISLIIDCLKTTPDND